LAAAMRVPESAWEKKGMSLKRAILWGFAQAISVLVLGGLAVGAAAQLQRWESSTDGFLDKVALALLLAISVLLGGLTVLGWPGYLVLQQRVREGVLVLASTTFWLVATLGVILILVILLDVHTIF
jgi:hypothetical protein